MTEYSPAKSRKYPRIFPNFENCAHCKIKTIASIWGENMLGYLSLDIICSSQFTVFLELCSRKTVCFSEQIMSADKYPSMFSRQMATIVYIFPNFQNCVRCKKDLKDNKDNRSFSLSHSKKINRKPFSG